MIKAVAISVVFVFVAIATSTITYPLTTESIDVRRGKVLFDQRCASCHTFRASGPTFGPDLATVRDRSARKFPDLAIEDYILESIVKPSARLTADSSQAMPENSAKGLDRSQILDIVAYVLSHSGEVDYAAIQSLEMDPRSLGKANDPIPIDVRLADQGLQLFLHKYSCTSCHSLDGQPGSSIFAPNLAKAGLHSEEYLRDSIMRPDKSVSPVYQQSLLICEGSPYTGKVVAESDDEVTLLYVDSDQQRALRVFRKQDLDHLSETDTIMPRKESLMPDYSKAITDEDLRAILEFLKTLR